MKRLPRPTLAAALASLVLLWPMPGAMAQSSAPSPALPDMAASAAVGPARTASAPVGPRLRSAAETGNRAVAPGDLQPERPVTKQISIPFGKKPAPPTQGEERAVQRGNPAATGGIDDAAARCEAQVDTATRESCRARLAQDAKRNLPK